MKLGERRPTYAVRIAQPVPCAFMVTIFQTSPAAQPFGLTQRLPHLVVGHSELLPPLEL